ncbi:MAG: hypothetical protein ACJAUV_002131 [Flavobacteriales bacterium]
MLSYVEGLVPSDVEVLVLSDVEVLVLSDVEVLVLSDVEVWLMLHFFLRTTSLCISAALTMNSSVALSFKCSVNSD